MIRILSIGNSFSEDAQRYLQKIAEANSVALMCMNLFIGGCSLETHYKNLTSNVEAYLLEVNGEGTGKKVSIIQALAAESWDYVTLQQVSNLAPSFDSYMPYLEELAKAVRAYAPNAKILLHQTWAYEQGCSRLNEELRLQDQHDMLDRIVSACTQAKEAIHADGIIPGGKAMMNAVDMGVGMVHRDTYHASLGVGRYLLALTWYLSMVSSEIKAYRIALDEPISDAQMKIIIEAAHAAVNEQKGKQNDQRSKACGQGLPYESGDLSSGAS